MLSSIPYISTKSFFIKPFWDPVDIWNHPSFLFSINVKWLKLPEAVSLKSWLIEVTHSLNEPSADWVPTVKEGVTVEVVPKSLNPWEKIAPLDVKFEDEIPDLNFKKFINMESLNWISFSFNRSSKVGQHLSPLSSVTHAQHKYKALSSSALLSADIASFDVFLYSKACICSFNYIFNLTRFVHIHRHFI